VNFKGTGTVTIRASYNVSSITDNGTGDYTVNFTTSFSSANYGYSGCGGWGASAAGGYQMLAPSGADPTASAFRVQTVNATPAIADTEFIGLSFFGDI
jgi:hypothetical protein